MSILTPTKELRELLDQMDVPDGRKNDIPWLSRNLGIRNNIHPNYPKALSIIKFLMKIL